MKIDNISKNSEKKKINRKLSTKKIDLSKVSESQVVKDMESIKKQEEVISVLKNRLLKLKNDLKDTEKTVSDKSSRLTNALK